MKINTDKCHMLVSSDEKVAIKIGSHGIASTEREKFLDVYLDSGLSYIISFDYHYHLSEICKKASRKVCAPARVTLSMSLPEKTSPY